MLRGQTVVLQIVDYGEDIKVKMVECFEDFSFEKAGYGSSSKTIRIKIVNYGEDIKLKQVRFGGYFKAIVK